MQTFRIFFLRHYIIPAAIIFSILVTATPILAAEWDLVLLTTSGLNGQLISAKEKASPKNAGMVRTFGGFARIQTIFKSYRDKYPGITMTIATGDDLMGESLSTKKEKLF